MIQIFTSTQDGTPYGASKTNESLNRLLREYPTARYVAHTVQLVCNTEINIWQQSITVIVEIETTPADLPHNPSWMEEPPV